MDITFSCSSCGQHISVDESGGGAVVQCPSCGQSLTVPKPVTAPNAIGEWQAGHTTSGAAKLTIAVLAVSLVVMSVVATIQIIRGRNPHRDTKLDVELQSLRAQVQSAKGELELAEKDRIAKETQVRQLDSQNQQLRHDLEELKNSDQVAFAEANKATDRDDRKAALLRFIDSHPGSTMISNARSIISQIDADIRREEDARREQAERARRLAEEERRQQEAKVRALAQRIQSGNATGQELSQILVGRSQSEVITLLGRPETTHMSGSVWLYEGVVRDPISGNRPTVRVWFQGDIVQKITW